MDTSPDRILELMRNETHHDERRHDILTEDAALMTIFPNSPDMHVAQGVYGGQVKRVLTELSGKRQRLYTKGTVDILFSGEDENGEPEEYIVPVKIRSISEDVMDRISQDYQAIAAEMPYRYNAETGEYEADRDAPEFMATARRLAEAQRELMYSKLVHGLDMTVTDEDDNVVWSAKPNGTKDKANTIRVLKDVMGITATAITKLVEAIDELSAGKAEADLESFEKKSMPQ